MDFDRELLGSQRTDCGARDSQVASALCQKVGSSDHTILIRTKTRQILEGSPIISILADLIGNSGVDFAPSSSAAEIILTEISNLDKNWDLRMKDIHGKNFFRSPRVQNDVSSLQSFF
jgi:hypothetical protein